MRKWKIEEEKIRRNSKWSVIAILVQFYFDALYRYIWSISWHVPFTHFDDLLYVLVYKVYCLTVCLKCMYELYKVVLMWMRRRPKSLAMKIEYWKIMTHMIICVRSIAVAISQSSITFAISIRWHCQLIEFVVKFSISPIRCLRQLRNFVFAFIY